LLDAVGSIALLHDHDNRVVEMNAVAERFTGYRTEELRGRRFWHEVVAADDVERYHRQFATIAEDVLPHGYETWWSLRDRSRRLVMWTHRPFVPADDDGLLLTTAFDVTDRRDRDERLEFLAYHDDLTGLANRRRFLEELDRRLLSGRRYAEPVAVVTVGVEALHETRDLLGNPAGDDVLYTVGARIRERLRASDLVARIGDQEFAVLLARADRECAEHVARDLVAAVAERPPTIGGERLPTIISTGAAAFPADAKTGASLLRTAVHRLDERRSRRRARDRDGRPLQDEGRMQAALERQARRQAMFHRAEPDRTP
jgi:diguanylate cyclase (GGDEF)-like protein/PAS domain S-box-containing protein